MQVMERYFGLWLDVQRREVNIWKAMKAKK